MKFLFVLVLYLCSAISFAQNPSYMWAKQSGGKTSDMGKAIVADDSGYVYSTGIFTDTADFNPGPGVANLISKGNNDIFINKLDSLGNLVWAKRIGGTGDDYSNAMALDKDGNIYITGRYNGIADFNPATETYNLYAGSDPKMFIAKYTTNGVFIWAKAFGGGLYNNSVAIALDSNKNIYTTGTYRGAADFDTDSLATYYLSNTGNGAASFVCKFDSTCSFIWAKAINGVGYVLTNALCLDQQSDVYVVGTYDISLDLDLNPSNYDIHTSGQTDAFIIKLNSAGNFSWGEAFRGNSSDYHNAHSVNVDPNNDVYVTGMHSGKITFGSYSLTTGAGSNIFLVKYNTSGQMIWAKTIGSVNQEYGYCVKNDSKGNVFIAGKFEGNVDFDPSNGFGGASSIGYLDAYICKYDSTGNYLWSYTFGGTLSDECVSIYVDKKNKIYATGYFNNMVDFDGSPAWSFITSFGNSDHYELKINDSQLSTNIQYTNNNNTYLFPNPLHENFTNLYLDKLYNTIYIKIYNVSGQLVYAETYNNSQFIKINIPVNNGIYILNVTSEKEIIGNYKLVKN